MIETVFVVVTVGVIVLPPVGFWWSDRADKKRKEREKAELIATGAMYGVDHIPGEDTYNFRRKVIDARDEEARRGVKGEKKW